MNLFFYANKNILFDFIARNIIAPDPIVRDIKRYRTVATLSDYFLFVTHKKLDRKSRERGIAEPEFVYPVTLVLMDTQETDGKAILVSTSEEGYEYTYDNLSLYDSEKHIGAYLIGEIPLSRVSRIYFDTQDEMDMFARPSPDYWYPINKFSLLPDGFTEEFSISLDQDRLIEVCSINPGEIIAGIRRREKLRAGILNLVNETRRWQCGKYIFSIDPTLQDLLGIKDEDISVVLPHYLEMRDMGHVEYLSLFKKNENSRDFNQTIFDFTCDVLLRQPYNTQKQSDSVTEILNDICEKATASCEDLQEAALVKNSIIEIEKLISDTSNMGPEEISAGIPEPIDVLKALLFVAKNPNRYDLFLEALDAYHADQLTKRRAALLWGFLNGLYGMPGKDHNKDNQQLWEFIEAFVYADETGQKPTITVNMPLVTIEKSYVLGIKLSEERVITASEVRRIIMQMPKEKLKKAFYTKLLEAAEVEFGAQKITKAKKKEKSKVEKMGYIYHTASLPFPEVKVGQKLTDDLRKALEQLLADFNSPVPNEDKLFQDYVVADGRFDFVFDLDPGYWKKAFKPILEMKNGERL